MSDKRSFVGVCSATSGCVLHANHAGECRVAEMSEEEYEVEALLKERRVGKRSQFLVKWQDWPEEDNTWEWESSLSNCKQKVREYRASAAAAKPPPEAPPKKKRHAGAVPAKAKADAKRPKRRDTPAIEAAPEPASKASAPQSRGGRATPEPAAAQAASTASSAATSAAELTTPEAVDGSPSSEQAEQGERASETEEEEAGAATYVPSTFGMSGLASRLLDAALEDGDMRGPLSGMFPVHLPVPSFADALAPLSDKLPKVEPSKGQLAKMAWKKAGSIQAQFPFLTRDECAAIVLYTMEDMPRERSPYYVMNAALREQNRQAVRPWRDFVWLLLHALRKLPPSKARMVYRGMAGSELAAGAELQWSAFSSTATKVDVMEVFLATSGQRTMIHLELTEPVGRDVSAFSLYPQECEVLLPPNVCFEVVSCYKAGSGLVIVQCKQTESLDALLDFGRRGDERDVSRLIELGAETRERAIELLERYGSLQAAANALCAAADTSIPSESFFGGWTVPQG
ncbi:hypothetical protein EMIHUDRAFT_231296 [Emiliania huxleyi CCMP1516]|uniref:NAD(P)(+)--arginine ADP-ribosyltransferase n=2 Tax=Emiliania huxleyi TaxID=2903 RepID=A0A0D3K7X5_EMIH1|nr:hypothetical protein EMIHUDRAFT_231296 [Emiliania huxleyi CCMP1516]EOD31860.1 hypothetical protein EMIHUDRAFT_231296 [Emiliania huxleyi CCMP1516]|eukprot:XP_005784289.1 hypothetical protein EMIHUDRAFT_231296 [Emiliania huxleyi CCMP1516]